MRHCELIPLIDLGAQYRELKTDLDAAIARTFATSQFILGQEVAAFEEEFAAYCRASFAVGANSGTSALHLALLAAGIGPGDEVITVPFTFYATVAAIDYCRATPVYVDIDPRTFNMDVSHDRRSLPALAPFCRFIYSARPRTCSPFSTSPKGIRSW